MNDLSIPKPITPCPTCDGITWYRRSGRWACPECEPPSDDPAPRRARLRLSDASGPWEERP